MLQASRSSRIFRLPQMVGSVARAALRGAGSSCLVLAVCSGLTLAAPSAGDNIDDLRAWTRSFERASGALDADERFVLKRLLTDLRTYRRSEGAQRQRALVALLDLQAAGRAAVLDSDRERAAAGDHVRGMSMAESLGLMDDGTERFLGREVLVVEADNPSGRRAAAAHLLGQRRGREALMALSVCARGPAGPVADAAFEALSGWEDESVHTLFLQYLARDQHQLPARVEGAIERHFRGLRLGSGDRSQGPLSDLVGARLMREDWRAAALAVSLSLALDDARAVPVLIEGLEIWTDRVQAGEPVRRVQNDIVRALVARAGRNIGPHPERWKRWWEAMKAGHATAGKAVEAGAQVTEASFFGLRPVTDRVLFIIDRSGSMETSFGARGETRTEAWNRYQESVDQMMRFLEGLGERTSFNVIVFNDENEAFRRRLTPATAGNRRQARAWLQRHGPRGGTHLRRAVESAMELDADGRVRLDRLEADTFIVLCDGKTTDGPGWVVPLLRRWNPLLQVVIHGVRIGSEGDGTLERLAEETGGEFVEVGG